MSFVDLMKDDTWSEVDITNRTESIVRAFISREDETILNRKIAGALLGRYTLSADEMAYIQSFDQASRDARDLGIQARADNQLLIEVKEYERVYNEHYALSQIPLSEDPDEAHNQTVALEALQAQIDAASTEVVDLALQRNRLEPVAEVI